MWKQGEPCSGRCVVEADATRVRSRNRWQPDEPAKKRSNPRANRRDTSSPEPSSTKPTSDKRKPVSTRKRNPSCQTWARDRAAISPHHSFAQQGTDRGLAEASQERASNFHGQARLLRQLGRHRCDVTYQFTSKLASPLSGCGRKFSLPPANVLPAICAPNRRGLRAGFAAWTDVIAICGDANQNVKNLYGSSQLHQ